MTPLNAYLKDFQQSGDLAADVKVLLLEHDHTHTYHHVRAVAAQAVQLAERFGGDSAKCEVAAWLHDISAIVPSAERIALAKALGIAVLPAEERFPMIVHQRLSVPIAQAGFNVTDPEILSAIECHTTLKANASLTDKIVFVADKIAWDQPGTPPYIAELQAGLEQSIDAAALAYLDYLWDIRDKLRVLHPWVVDARDDLR